MLENLKHTQLDPNLKDVGYLTTGGKKSIGISGEVAIVDASGDVIDSSPDVETLISEADIVGATDTGDAGGDVGLIVDSNATFSVANVAVGYLAHQVTDAQSALVTGVSSATNVQTAVLSGAATWASKVYRVPLVKRYEIDMEGYNLLTLQYSLRNGASLNTYMKIYGTLDFATDANSDTGWIDISYDILGSATGLNCPATTTLTSLVVIDLPTPILKYMIKIVVECSIATAPDNEYSVLIKKSI